MFWPKRTNVFQVGCFAKVVLAPNKGKFLIPFSERGSCFELYKEMSPIRLGKIALVCGWVYMRLWVHAQAGRWHQKSMLFRFLCIRSHPRITHRGNCVAISFYSSSVLRRWEYEMTFIASVVRSLSFSEEIVKCTTPCLPDVNK